MSQENVEVVQASNEAWNAGDMEALRELYAPDAMIVTLLEGWPEGTDPVVGQEAVIRFFTSVREAWEADLVEPIVDFIDVGDRVVSRMIWRGPRPRIEHGVHGRLHRA